MTVITTNTQPVSDSNSESHSNGNRVAHIAGSTCSSSELNDYADQAEEGQQQEAEEKIPE